MMGFKPLLAGKVVDTAKLPYDQGLVASTKLDGIRAVHLGTEGLVSRNLKAIPNRHVQKLFASLRLLHVDGELICGDPRDKQCYRNTYSAVMSADGEPDVSFYVFDHFGRPHDPFSARYDTLMNQVARVPKVEIVVQEKIANETELLTAEERWLEAGYEGAMIRRIDGHYKPGRSTDKEAILLKLKRFTDGEAIVVGFEELMRNANEPELDALGYIERSTHQENLIPMNTLGALVVRLVGSNVTFRIGTGFTLADRHTIWANRDAIIGKLVRFKHFEIGAKDKPRFPVFLGFRDWADL